MEPNLVNIRLWVEALRSGAYKQARSVLRDGDVYCCLGVACDISGLGLWDVESYNVGNGDRSFTVLPRGVMDWLGLNSANPELIFAKGKGGGNAEMTAAFANDSARASFDEIADAIALTYLTKGALNDLSSPAAV